jgi:fumarate hydratase class I
VFQKQILELIRQVSTNLPADVVEALVEAKNREVANSRGRLSLQAILKNIELAQKQSVPICQDTGWPTFFVRAPYTYDRPKLKKQIIAAVQKATKLGYLRPNAVDSLTGKNSGDNTGEYYPTVYFERTTNKNVEIALLLKGGGSENVSAQVSLPMETDFGRAGRDVEGVKKAVLQIVKDAQGKGCAPGIIAVAIGGDRTRGWLLAKRDLLKPINEENPDPKLRKFEVDILRSANKLGIGPLGLGGKTTLLGCRASVAHRLPASFFVTVAYSCWAERRGEIVMNAKGQILSDTFSKKVITNKLELEKIKKLHLPINETEVRKLKVGDIVSVSGKMFTGRDRVHELAIQKKLPKDLKDSAIYHCGPVAIQNGKQWKFIAAGPTTSIRLENYKADFIKKTGIRVVIGKGGMGAKTAAALKKHGAVYLHAIGGAAAFYSEKVKKVTDVKLLKEFGVPEALWEIEVEDFLAVVSMDSEGRSLHKI